jgi:lysophospholipase L1-like esterase
MVILAEGINIACVGDSITAGMGLGRYCRRKGLCHNFPELLQQKLGDGYKVWNLGVSGHTMQKNGDRPYWVSSAYSTLLNSNPDIVIIMLGTNDAKTKELGGPGNWANDGQTGAAQYEDDYKAMIDSIKNLPSKPAIYIMIPPPAYAQHWGISKHVVNEVFPGLIPKINQENALPFPPIDIFNAMGGASLSKSNLFGDGIHPNAAGYKILAATVYQALITASTTTLYTGTTTNYTGTTTTTTVITVTLPPFPFMLRSSGSQDCLTTTKDGNKKLFPRHGSGSCVKFVTLGRQIKALHNLDSEERCLTIHKKTKGWVLWKCSLNRDFQQFVTSQSSVWPASEWCSLDHHCVAVYEDVSSSSTTLTTSGRPTPWTSTSTSTELHTTAIATTTSTAHGKTIQSGNVVFLKAHSGNGNHMDVQGQKVGARWQSQGSFQALTIEKANGGVVYSGDVIYLKAHTGAHVDVVDGVVQARWADTGIWQAMTIQKKIGSGALSPNDIVCLKAHTGKYLDVVENHVQARFTECADWQAMRLESEVIGALFSGDSIHLLAHTGNRMEAEGTLVRARWPEAGAWQTFSIMNYGGRAIFSGDAVFLRAHTGLLVHVEDVALHAEWNDYGDWQRFIIHRKGGDGAVMPGDTIFLRAHTGKVVHVHGETVEATWYDQGLWQSLVIEKASFRRLNQNSMDAIVLV